MPTILATGGLGFIGSHTSVVFLENGFDVVALDSLVNSSESKFFKINKIINCGSNPNKGSIFFKKGDVRDKEFLRDIFEEFKRSGKPIESVIHFAGLKAVSESIIHPLKYWDMNINCTLSLLSVMEEFHCRNLIFSSSATVYKSEMTLDKKFTEESSLSPINPYGNTKLTIEKILSDLSESKPNSWRIGKLRYFNPVGAHKSGYIGEDPKQTPNNLLPVLLKVVNKEKNLLSIFGKDWPTKDGTCIRDFIHVMDLAEAHFSALQFLLSNDPQNISLNIGTGKGTSVLEFIETFINTNKCSLPYEFADRRAGDSPYSVADNKKALNLLNWRPIRCIKEICEDAWNWNNTNIREG